ncbi:MAG: hypothetical protein CFE25_16005 [Chitinophagaceae bacterium BSSC1]|nr:MAG: hypothetical protein CFE25_16005 [Chitinophagaceae bacterium BSSC1]
MKKYSLIVFSLFVFSIGLHAQGSKTVAAKKSTTPFEKIMTDMGFPYEKINDSIAVIVFDGANLKSYKLYCLKVDDMYISYVNLSTALPKKIGPSNYPSLLTKNYSMDFVKIGMSESSKEFYVRADVYINGTTAANFKKIVAQIADATDIIAADFK